MKRLLENVLLAALLVALASPVLASTPDGLPPSNETVCDILIGATPGLYGLCVAYCEAQDCDFEAAVSAQCRAPNPPILTNYERRRKAGDPDMPCIQTETECPCWTTAELAQIEAVDPNACLNTPTIAFIQGVSPDFAGLFPSASDPGALQCNFSLFDGVNFIVRTFDVNAEEEAACRAQLESAGAAAGFTCF